eukprot:2979760-Rhodomonas_salina.1
MVETLVSDHHVVVGADDLDRTVDGSCPFPCKLWNTDLDMMYKSSELYVGVVQVALLLFEVGNHESKTLDSIQKSEGIRSNVDRSDLVVGCGKEPQPCGQRSVNVESAQVRLHRCLRPNPSAAARERVSLEVSVDSGGVHVLLHCAAYLTGVKPRLEQ